MTPPPVLRWFKVYCAVLCAIYALVAAAGIAVLLVDPAALDMPPLVARATGGVLFAMGALLMAATAAPFFLAPQPWVWTYDLIVICLGLTSACFLPACIPLLIYWIRPEVKAYFGKA